MKIFHRKIRRSPDKRACTTKRGDWRFRLSNGHVSAVDRLSCMKVVNRSGQVRYGSTCRDGTSPRSPFCSTPSAYSGRPPGPAPGPLTIRSYDHPTALTTTSWDAPAGLELICVYIYLTGLEMICVYFYLTGLELSAWGCSV